MSPIQTYSRTGGLETSLEQIRRHWVALFGVGRRSVASGRLGLQPQLTAKPCNPCAAGRDSSSTQLTLDARRALAALGSSMHRQDFLLEVAISTDPGGLGVPATGVVAAARHSQNPADPGNPVLAREPLDQLVVYRRRSDKIAKASF